MYPRRPVLALGLAVGVLLAGMGTGLRATTSDPLAAGADVTERGVSATATSTIDTEPIAASATIEVVAHAPTLAGSPPAPRDAPVSMVLGDMKHVWQSLNNCGPAAVVMALSAMGIDVPQETARLALRGTDVRRGMGPQGVGPWV